MNAPTHSHPVAGVWRAKLNTPDRKIYEMARVEMIIASQVE